MLARSQQQFVKWLPIVAPIDIKSNALTEFCFTNFAAPPFVENVLIARKNRFHTQNHGPVAGLCAFFQQSRSKTLRSRQRMIIANQQNIGAVHERVELLPIENGLIGAVSLGEVPKIFATSVMILSPDLTFDTGQRVELRRTASGSQASGGCHGSSLVVLVLRGRSLSWDWSRSTCDQGPTINDRP